MPCKHAKEPTNQTSNFWLIHYSNTLLAKTTTTRAHFALPPRCNAFSAFENSVSKTALDADAVGAATVIGVVVLTDGTAAVRLAAVVIFETVVLAFSMPVKESGAVVEPAVVLGLQSEVR